MDSLPRAVNSLLEKLFFCGNGKTNFKFFLKVIGNQFESKSIEFKSKSIGFFKS